MRISSKLYGRIALGLGVALASGLNAGVFRGMDFRDVVAADEVRIVEVSRISAGPTDEFPQTIAVSGGLYIKGAGAENLQFTAPVHWPPHTAKYCLIFLRDTGEGVALVNHGGSLIGLSSSTSFPSDAFTSPMACFATLTRLFGQEAEEQLSLELAHLLLSAPSELFLAQREELEHVLAEMDGVDAGSGLARLVLRLYVEGVDALSPVKNPEATAILEDPSNRTESHSKVLKAIPRWAFSSANANNSKVLLEQSPSLPERQQSQYH